MDLSILIQLLLKDNETVIVPGFGAFISVYKPAVIRENDIVPPGKEIRFFHQIKNNDGLLAMHIARSKKISYDDAFKRIEKATSKIIYQLDKGETVGFGELGEFMYGEAGEIIFKPFENTNAVSQLEPISLEDITETPEENQLEPVNAPAPATDEEPEVIENKAGDIQNLPVEEEVVPHQQEEEIKPETANKKPFDIPAPEPAKKEETEKRKSFAWFWILIVIIAAAVAILLLINKQSETTTEDKNQVHQAVTVQPEIVTPDTIQPSDTIPAPVSQQQATVVSQSFHLIGGGFKSEENALKYIAKLKEKGIEGTLLGQKGKIYLVGIASFSSEQEAYNELNRRMNENPDWKLWVYEK